MISFITSAINGAALTASCLEGLRFSLEELGLESPEIILIDDNSQDLELEQVYLDFKNNNKHLNVKVYKFLQRQQYSAAVSFGLSMAKGDLICFISNDMIITPNCLNTLIAVIESEPEIGAVRTTSNYSDCLQEFKIVSPLLLRNYDDIWNFSTFVSQYYELNYQEHDVFVGDLFLVKREVIDKIGYFDRQFWGYYGDVDFGIRLRKAGFKIVTAQGAWLYHLGAGHLKNQVKPEDDQDQKIKALMEQRLKDVAQDYQVFINKYKQPFQEYSVNLRYEQDCQGLIAQEIENFNLYVEPYEPKEGIVIEL